VQHIVRLVLLWVVAQQVFVRRELPRLTSYFIRFLRHFLNAVAVGNNFLSRHPSQKGVLFHELDELALVLSEDDLAHELGNAELLDNLEQVNLCVESVPALLEDALFFGFSMALPAASTIEPAAELVDKLDQIVAAALIVSIVEYLPVVN